MRSTFQIHRDINFGSDRQSSKFDFPIETEKTNIVNHSFSHDILKVNSGPFPKSTPQAGNGKFSDALYQELLNGGMGSKENFERVFHLQ